MNRVTNRVTRGRRGRSGEAGFTLLEILVATVILGSAIVGLLGNVAVSTRNAAILVDHDRQALIARRQMDALLLDRTIPRDALLTGTFQPEWTSGIPAGWRARLTVFETPPNPSPSSLVLERVQLEVWLGENEETRRIMQLEGFRSAYLGGGAAPQ